MIKKLSLSLAFLAMAGAVSAQIGLVPNGDFENGDTSWIRVDGVDNPGAAVIIPSGGNTGAFATITPQGGWGILVNPPEAGATGAGAPIAGFGKVAGDAITFSLDMISLNLNTSVPSAGPVGGMKVEAWGSNAMQGDTGDIRPSLIGDGSTWETYTIDWTLPAGTEKLIFVPVWDSVGSKTVGFDNIGVVPEPSTYALLGGLFALGFVVYRRRKAA